MHVTPDATDRGMVVPSPLAWQPLPTRRRRPWVVISVLVVALIVAILVLDNITVPYYGILPGDALPVDGAQGAVTIGKNHVGSGNLFLATVLLQPRITVWERLTDFLHPDDDIVPSASVTGGVSSTAYNAENAEAMADSQEYAKVTALRRLGYSVPEHGDGAQVVAIDPGTPAAGVFQQGDVITSFDGRPVKISSDLTAEVTALTPGAVAMVGVSRPGPHQPTALTLSARTVACGPSICPDDPNRALMGVSVITDDQSFTYPRGVNVSIATNGIGGPSAGLAFTLGTIDALTTRDITGGHRVAATGQIEINGTVDDVGGVKQKTIAVEAEHCQYFIVPRVEYQTAESEAHGKLKVIPVDDLDQALAFLRSIGGNLTGVPVNPPATFTS
jgi:PDZ domain-containing protein